MSGFFLAKIPLHRTHFTPIMYVHETNTNRILKLKSLSDIRGVRSPHHFVTFVTASEQRKDVNGKFWILVSLTSTGCNNSGN
jgi:hypothetical protein